MKFLKNTLLLSLVLVLLIALSACGDSTNAEAAGDASTLSTDTAVTNDSGTAATDVTASAVPEAVENTIPGPDASATADGLLGNWVDINDSSRFANIAKTDSGYSYEDNEGTYEGTFKDGILEIKVSDTDTAKAYIDTKSGHLFSTYMDGYSEFTKK